MAHEVGQEEAGHGPIGRAISTSVRGNSTAFGFSITITVSFGTLSQLLGKPSLLEMLLFGVAAATSVALLEGAITRGFRAHLSGASQEVQMLGTAMNFASVAAGVGAAIAVGELFGGVPAWPVGAFLAATVYIATESAEILVAERIQSLRGDPQAEPDG